MGKYKKAYIFNRSYNDFEDNSISIRELVELKKSHDARFTQIYHDLYSHKILNDNYKLAFACTDNIDPYLRRINASAHKEKGFASACESVLHDSIKRGIASSEKLKICINRKYYTIVKKHSDVEKICSIMENDFETDCEFEILNIDPELHDILDGSTIYFEIHHKSKVNPLKSMAYTISNKPILEFEVQTQYIPYAILHEQTEFEDCVNYFKEYYEDTDKHYISGTFHSPINYHIDWKGKFAEIHTPDGNKINIKLFYRENSYRILYILNDNQKKYDNDMFNKSIREFDTVKRFAEYRIHEHLAGRKNLFL